MIQINAHCCWNFVEFQFHALDVPWCTYSQNLLVQLTILHLSKGSFLFPFESVNPPPALWKLCGKPERFLRRLFQATEEIHQEKKLP